MGSNTGDRERPRDAIEQRRGTDRDQVRTVLDVLDRRGAMHVTGIGEHAGVDPVAGDQECFDLERKGYVRAKPGGVYALTARGKNRLRNLRGLE